MNRLWFTENTEPHSFKKKLGVFYLGTACFILDDGNHRIIIDPGDFFTNRFTKDMACNLPPFNLIILTHADFDHCNRLLYLKNLCSIPVIGTESVIRKFTNIHVLTGHEFKNPWIRVTKIDIPHGVLHNKDHCGYIITFGGKVIYFLGDGILPGQELAPGPDLLFVSLCGLECSPANACTLITKLKPFCIIPMHWELFRREDRKAVMLRNMVDASGLQVHVHIPPYLEWMNFE